MQEGTHKRINKERNEKTTRNIQEGLPFTIADVKRQTEDELLTTVSRIDVYSSFILYATIWAMKLAVLNADVSNVISDYITLHELF